MQGFKKYLKNEETKNLIGKLPKNYQKLVSSFEIKFLPSSTLPGDEKHVGLVTTQPNKITLASPVNWGRSFVLYHEIGHLVYEKYVRGTPYEQEWISIAKNTKNTKKDESPEELFAHSFANRFVEYPHVIFDHPTWTKFFDELIKRTGN